MSQSLNIASAARVLWVGRFDYLPEEFIDRHLHPNHHQIFHVIEGRGLFQIEGREYLAPAGTSLWIPPGYQHEMHVLGRRSVRTLDCKYEITHPELLAWTQSLPLLNPLDPDLVRATLLEIHESAHTMLPQRQALCDVLICKLLILAGSGDQLPSTELQPGQALQRSGEDIADAVLEWIEAHCQDDLNSQSLERACGYSYRHLAQICRGAFSCTPRQLIQRVRVQKAQQLLLSQPERSAESILLAVGFASAAHGSRIFSQLSGMAPLRWRKRQRDHIGLGTVLAEDFSDHSWLRRIP